LKLKEDVDGKIMKLGRKTGNAGKLVYSLYRKPVVNINDIVESLKITERSARDLINEMEKLEIISEVTGFKRNRVFSFKKYLELF
jgi:hypothetical protein